MPTDILALPASSLNTKWKEPYASASLNQRFVGITAPGIYRGLRMEPDPSLGDRTVLVAADPDKLDHVAVYENASGFSVTYRDSTSGDITLSLAGYASVDVVVCVFVNYQTGVSTTGAFRIYTVAEFVALSPAIRDALVILGTVTVPASGAISLAGISLIRRTLASTNLSRGTILNAPLIRNPGFESGETNATHAKSSLFWDKSMTVGTGTWKTVGAPVASGMKSIELAVTAGPVTGDLSQQIGVETAVDELFFVSVSVKQLKTISSGAFVFFMEWSDVNDALLTTTTVTLDGGAVDSSFRIVEIPVTAPAGSSSLRAVGIRATALSPSTTGIFGYIDNVDVLMEPRDTRHPYPFDQAFRRATSASRVALVDKAVGFSGLSASMRFDASTPASEGRVLIEPGDNADLPPALAVLGRLHEIGANLLDTQLKCLIPRISWENGGFLYTLLWESAPAGGGIGVLRQYVDSGGNAFLTENASYNDGGGVWQKDVNGQPAHRHSVGSLGIRNSYQIGGTNSWADAGWLKLLDISSAGLDALGPFVTNLTMSANRHVAISGTGQYKHGIKTLCVPLFDTFAGAVAPGGTLTMVSPNFTVRMFNLPVGKRIIRLRSKITDSASGPTRIRMAFRRIDGGGSSSRLYDGVQSAGSGALQTITTADFAETVTYDNVYGGEWYFQSGSASSVIRTLEVDYDEP